LVAGSVEIEQPPASKQTAGSTHCTGLAPPLVRSAPIHRSKNQQQICSPQWQSRPGTIRWVLYDWKGPDTLRGLVVLRSGVLAIGGPTPRGRGDTPKSNRHPKTVPVPKQTRLELSIGGGGADLGYGRRNVRRWRDTHGRPSASPATSIDTDRARQHIWPQSLASETV